MKRLILLCCLSVLTVGCRTPQRVREAMISAEALGASRCDSALTLMRGIYPKSLRSKRDRAEYGLIYSMVLDKNAVDVDRDTLIRPAVAYYERYGTPARRATALYYWGRVLENADSIERAIEIFTRARRMLDKDTLCRIHALLCNRLGDAHAAQYEFRSADRMYRASAETFAALGERYNELIGCQRITCNAIKCGDYPVAKKWNDRTLSLAAEMRDTDLLILANVYHANLLSYLVHDYEGAIRHIFKTAEKYSAGQIDAYCRILTMLYLNQGQLDSSKYYIDILARQQFPLSQQEGILQIKRYIERLRKNYRELICTQDELISLQDTLLIIRTEESVQKYTKKYNYIFLQQQAEIAMLHNRNRIRMLMCILILCIFIIIWCLHKVREQRIKIAEQMTTIRNFTRSEYILTDRVKELAERELFLKKQVEKRFEQIRKLACESHLTLACKASDLKKRIEPLVFDEGMFGDIERMVDMNMSGVMGKVRKGVFGRFTEADCRLLSMILFGFSMQECQIFMGYTNYNLYTRRSRLRARVKQAGGDESHYLLDFLDDKRACKKI